MTFHAKSFFIFCNNSHIEDRRGWLGENKMFYVLFSWLRQLKKLQDLGLNVWNMSDVCQRVSKQDSIKLNLGKTMRKFVIKTKEGKGREGCVSLNLRKKWNID